MDTYFLFSIGLKICLIVSVIYLEISRRKEIKKTEAWKQTSAKTWELYNKMDHSLKELKRVTETTYNPAEFAYQQVLENRRRKIFNTIQAAIGVGHFGCKVPADIPLLIQELRDQGYKVTPISDTDPDIYISWLHEGKNLISKEKMTFEEAKDWAEKQGGRLPTKAELEK